MTPFKKILFMILMVSAVLGLAVGGISLAASQPGTSDVDDLEQMVREMRNQPSGKVAAVSQPQATTEVSAPPIIVVSPKSQPAAAKQDWPDVDAETPFAPGPENAITQSEPAGDPAPVPEPLAAAAEPAVVEPEAVTVTEEPVPAISNSVVAVPVEELATVPVSEAKGIDPEIVDPNDDLRKQTVESITERNLVDQYFREAKSIKLPTPAPKEVVVQELEKTRTNEEIVRSLIKPHIKDQRIDLDFEEVKLGDMFMTLGQAAELNIMLDPELKTRSTDFHLKQVSVEEALILTANAFNLGFKIVGDSLYVTDKEKLQKENLVSKVIKLHNIPVAEAKGLIGEIVKSVNISEEINSLIVVGQPEEIMKIEEIIKAIDKPQPQVLLEARIIEVNRDALKDLGVDWSDQISLAWQESGMPVEFSDPENPVNDKPFQIQAFSRSAMQFNTAIKMLENQNKAKVLSTPRIVTLNNKEAEIFVGDRFPYTVTTISGGVATTDVRFEEPGIRLKITPSIIEEDFVVIKVEPEVSFIFGFRGPDDQYPWTKKREATAYVRVQNNQPFIMGGILNQEDKKNFYKVPMLGNIPLLGNLFSYKKDTVVDTELIITIVPTIVHGEL